MKRMTKIVLLIFGIILYFNIGYLMAYSFDPSAQPTIASNICYRIVDFTGLIGKAKKVNTTFYLFLSIGWPVVLIFFWMVNLSHLAYLILVWLFTGGFFK